MENPAFYEPGKNLTPFLWLFHLTPHAKKSPFWARRVFPSNPKLFFHNTYLIHYLSIILTRSSPLPPPLGPPHRPVLYAIHPPAQKSNLQPFGENLFSDQRNFRILGLDGVVGGGCGCGLMMGKRLGVSGMWGCGIFTLWRRPWVFFVGNLAVDFWCVALWRLYLGASIFISRAFLGGACLEKTGVNSQVRDDFPGGGEVRNGVVSDFV